MKIIKQLKYVIKIKKNTISQEENAILQMNFNIHNDKNKQMYIIHKALQQQLKNKRIRNAHTKTRSEVRGGGKKPWKQKGTGRARAGSTRSPLWKGGGTIFGPRKKIYKSKINKKEKKLALRTIIYNKFPNTIITDQLLNNLNQPNTKYGIQELNQLGINLKSVQKILIIVEKSTRNLYLSYRNIKNVNTIEAKNINILSLLKADIIIMTPESLKLINQMNK
uniref:Large ribosomal subunit protein uL4c n=1 Tax=Sonderella linearis TaxID=110477 RepID=A0A1Z1MMK1_9FLOR|nr:ribosomal protein L4 [Sonderella linearis]ARW67072.1 ribosomal protein L4 [Sonderella linearis]